MDIFIIFLVGVVVFVADLKFLDQLVLIDLSKYLEEVVEWTDILNAFSHFGGFLALAFSGEGRRELDATKSSFPMYLLG